MTDVKWSGGVLPLAAARSFAVAMGLSVEPLRDAWALRSMHLCTRQPPDAKSALAALVGHLEACAALEDQADNAV